MRGYDAPSSAGVRSHRDCGRKRTFGGGNCFAQRVHHRNRSGGCAALKCGRENIRRSYRVLNCEIDADAADWRHGVRCVADTEQSGAIPFLQTIDDHGEQFNVVPTFQFVLAAAQKWLQTDNVIAKRMQTFLAYAGEAPLAITKAHCQ